MVGRVGGPEAYVEGKVKRVNVRKLFRVLAGLHGLRCQGACGARSVA